MPITEKEWKREKRAPITIINEEERKIIILFEDGDRECIEIKPWESLKLWKQRLKEQIEMDEGLG